MSCSRYLKLNEKKCSFLLVYIISVLSLLVFLYGFFPLHLSSNSTHRKNTKIYYKPRYIDKLAFIVIDALRYDFVMPSEGRNYMPFVLSSVLNNESCLVITKAHSPTVTLPRLKAITSGSLSSYIDVVLNFMAPSFEEENLINLAVTHGLKLVFYGDDTWLKLFPNSFIRSEGTTSFFTKDYVEVDSNVTRHVDDELKKDDWDIIILHFLGLDHIGHTEGPNSQLVHPKLLEMDDVVKKFFSHFKNLEKTRGLKTMLIVTGDHGMKDSGSHGGVTYAEVTVPLVSVGNPCVNLPGWSEDNTALQIDLAPTLSTLLGLTIPGSSMGKMIPQLLHYLQKEDILKNLELNRMELSRIMSSSDKDSDFIKMELETWLLNSSKNQELGINITKKYYETLNQMSRKLVSSNTSFNLFYLSLGVISLWVCLILLLHDFFNLWPSPQTPIHWFFIFGTISHGISLSSTSFIEEEHQTWYFFWTTFCVFALLESLHYMRKKSAIDFSSFIWWIFLAVLHRTLRKLNQTGDKWAFLPDIKFYLNSEEGQIWLFLLFLFGTGMVFFCAFKEKCPTIQLVTYGITLSAVIAYRIATDNFKLKYLKFYSSSRGFPELLVFWTSLSSFLIQTIYSKTPLYLIWLAFTSLVLRPHNIILLPIQAFTSKRLYRFFGKSGNIWNSVAHIWMGNVFYFYQGNGNSLSNIDVAAGFVGISTYSPAYAGVMIFIHTFNSHILSYILSPKSDLGFPLLRLLPVTMYCTIAVFHLNHLFIWSVFSPKLLYESSITILFLLLLILNQVLSFLKISM